MRYKGFRETFEEKKIQKKNLGVAILLISMLFALTVGPVMAPPVAYSAGDVFAGVGAGKIKHFSPAGVLLDTLDTTTGSSEQTGMAFDSAGNLYATDWTANKMSTFDNMGNLLVANWGGPFNQHPESVVFDAVGNVYVGESDGL